VIGCDEITVTSGVLLHFCHSDALTYGQVKPIHVLFQEGDDLLSGHKSVRIVALILGTGQPSLPIRCIKDEGIPPMIAPRVGRSIRLFQDHMNRGPVDTSNS